MEEQIKKIEEAIAANLAIAEKRSPWLETSLGHLRAAIEHLKVHALSQAPSGAATAPAAPQAATNTKKA